MGRARIAALGALLMTCVAAPAGAQQLSEAEVVRRALASNPTLRAAMAEARASAQSLEAVERGATPLFYAGASGGYTESPAATGEGVTFNPTARGGTTLGVRATTDLGTTIDVGVGGSVRYSEINRDNSTTQRVILGPNYGLDATVEVRQPLLRGTDARPAAIDAARSSREASEHAHDAAASEVLQATLAAYWELWYAERALEVQREGLALAQRQLREAELRASTLGDLAPSEVLRFLTQAAQLEEAVASAEQSRDQRAIELAQLMGASPRAIGGLEVAADAPEPGAVPALSTVLSRMRASSSDLLALEADLEASRHRARSADDAARPRLDLWTQVSASSLYADDMSDPFARPALGAMVGVDLELPLGGSTAQAQRDVAYTNIDAAEARYEARVAALEAQAASVIRQLETQARTTALAQRSAEIAAQLAVAERQRLALGDSTPMELLAAQQTERESALRHLRSLVDHASASLLVDHLSGALLERFARTTGSAS